MKHIQNNHLLTLDAMRGLAALMVLAYHRRWTLPEIFQIEHAYLAVDFFFMLSGFVIALAYERKITNGMKFVDFTKIRIIRLYPIIILAGAIAAICSVVSHKGANVTLSSLFTTFALPAPPSLVKQPFEANGPVWSLFFEIVVNFIYFGVIKLTKTKTQLCLFIASGLTWFAKLYHHGFNVGFNFNTLEWGVVRAIFPFAIGVAIFRIRGNFIKIKSPLGFQPLLIVLGIILSVSRSNYLDSTTWGVACTIVLFPIIIALSSLVVVPQNRTSLATWLGAVSFPVYDLHQPLYSVADQVFNTMKIPRYLEVPVAGSIICILSAFILNTYDIPVRKFLSSKLGKKQRRAPNHLKEAKLKGQLLK